MLRYAHMMRDGLLEAGHEVTLATPRQVLNTSGRPAAGVWKWVGYLDKFVLSAGEIARAERDADVVHVCDHGNAMYVPEKPRKPYVVTCHDLLAVRGALGENTDVVPSLTGRQFQRLILNGMRRAQAVACVSRATLQDAQRILVNYAGKLVVNPNSLAYAYRTLSPQIRRERLAAVRDLHERDAYVLIVGANHRRKNREAALRAVANVAASWKGKIVFAGDPPNAELKSLAARLGILERIVEVVGPSNELLEALYNGALALLFPSRFEGFGWPLIEAQACGCPVICSDAPPLPEVTGDAAVLCHAEDHEAFGRAVLEMANNPQHRARMVQSGLANAGRYGRAQMIDRFVALYEQVRSAA